MKYRLLVLFLVIIGCAIGVCAQKKSKTQNKAKSKTQTNSLKAKQIYNAAIKKSSTMSAEAFVTEMRKAIKADKQFIDPYWAIAKSKLDKPNEVIEILSLAIKNDAQKKDETIFRLAETYKSIGDYDKALSTIMKISASNPAKTQIVGQYYRIVANDEVARTIRAQKSYICQF